jgi:hypothetical protein
MRDEYSCPKCKRKVRVVDGVFVTHDINEFQRAVCLGSNKKRRPSASQRRRRNELVATRLSEDEADALARLAYSRGVSQSAYVRKLILNAIDLTGATE